MEKTQERRMIEQFIYNRLPQDLKELTENFKDRERDIVLLSSLGVLSNCIPNIFGDYDGNSIYPHLYVLIIAPPASGKGVMNYSRALIEPVHDKIFNESLSGYLICEENNQGKRTDKEDCPKVDVKILPANISTSEMYSYLGNSNHGLLIIESEADTMSNMLKNDWSNYSDVLRKAFHHEPISISRKIEKVFENIKEPKLAIVISGTPDQLRPLVQSKDNGLFSRFITYSFDEISEFKNVFAKNRKNNKLIFEKKGKEVYNLYESLCNLEVPIEFSFSVEQQQKFYNRIKPIREDILNNHAQSFISNLHRHALVCFKIAMIFTALRNKDNLHTFKTITCSNVDFIISLRLTQTLLRHNQFTFNTIENSGGLSIQDDEILSALGERFTTQRAYEVGEQFGVPNRTMFDKLQQWSKKRLIRRIKKGNYRTL